MKIPARCRIGFLFCLSLSASTAIAQNVAATSGPLRVFLDCNAQGCDFDYFRTEIPYVDYVRDRTAASVHVLLSTQATGGGGREYTFNFIGLRDLAGVSDTLRYVSAQGSTSDDLRKGILRTLKLGLVRYLARTPAAERLQVSYAEAPAGSQAKAVPTHDPWNYWVFRTRANGNFNGESSQRFANLSGSFSADRLTKEWKFNNSVRVSYSESKFTFSDGTGFSSYSRSNGLSHLAVKSLSDHWSVGERMSTSSSTYQNMRRSFRFAPAVEYNIFPYSQSTRKQLTIQYSAGINSFHYRDTTIFEKIHEVRPDEALSASISMTQPWGSMSGSIQGSNYLDDFTKRRLELFNSMNARLFKGFSFNLFGSLSLVRDQISIAKGGASEQEILLQRRQLATSYSYFVGIGLTYTFGSIFNNVVNPRFEGASGSFFF
ncbi:MAG TPA: hypothetical protein VM053_08220 [Gemmatimonadaceae bacterium]|nr:hypothetical protein [Gemmatimonadaceae bacterium]